MTDDEAGGRDGEEDRGDTDESQWDDEASGTGDRFDEEADPFGGTDDDVDDPFAELGDGVAGSDPVDPEPIDSASTGTDPAGDEPVPGDTPVGASEAAETTVPDADPRSPSTAEDPFDELGPAAADDAADGLGDAFERMDVGGVAEEDVWESIDEDAGSDRFSPGAAESADERADEVEHVVDKRTYCQQCPHFSAPPDVACTHEGTTIVEAVGFDEFRVRNCPMVSEEDPTFDAER